MSIYILIQVLCNYFYAASSGVFKVCSPVSAEISYAPDAAVDREPIHKTTKSLPGNVTSFIRSSWPLVFAVSESFRYTAPAVFIIDYAFDPVFPGPAEEKESAFFKRIQVIAQFHQGSKTCGTSSEICLAAFDDDLAETLAFLKHGLPPL